MSEVVTRSNEEMKRVKSKESEEEVEAKSAFLAPLIYSRGIGRYECTGFLSLLSGRQLTVVGGCYQRTFGWLPDDVG